MLEEFIGFGARRCPARRAALVILNHGSGFWVPPGMLSRGNGRGRPRRRPAGPGRRRRPLLATTRERLQERSPAARGIAYDDGSADCLDNQELQRVLAAAHRLLGRPLDLLGLDACLMTMVEVACQLREHARVLVGSEELEPGPGWPHAAILGDLTRNPTMTGPELGAAIVQRYVEAVGLHVDLHHLALNLARACGLGRVADASREIQRLLEARGGRGPIIARGHVGRRMAPSRGLSIYFPARGAPTAQYRDLDFAQRTAWGQFLEAYLGRERAGGGR